MEKQKHYRQAFEIACQEICSLDPAEMAAHSGAGYRVMKGKKQITLAFFGDPYTIIFPEIEITSAKGGPVSLVTRIMLLHYVIRADGTESENRLIPYKEIPGGMQYASVFEKRVVESFLLRSRCSLMGPSIDIFLSRMWWFWEKWLPSG